MHGCRCPHQESCFCGSQGKDCSLNFIGMHLKTVHTYLTTSIPLQVYAVALYVEAEAAANELGIRHRGGFFQGDRC